MKNKKNTVLQVILWIIQGALVGIGAILPGISGGTLCYAFGIYNQLLEVLFQPLYRIGKHLEQLIVYTEGVAKRAAAYTR